LKALTLAQYRRLKAALYSAEDRADGPVKEEYQKILEILEKEWRKK